MDRNIPFFRDAMAIQHGTDRFAKMIGERAPNPLSASAAFRKSKMVFEATVGERNYLPSVFLEAGAAAAKAVGRIVVREGVNHEGIHEAEGWKGTGFLVAPNLLLTNHHVLNSVDVCNAATFQLNYRNRLDGSADKYDEYPVRPGELFLTSPAYEGLDYTFVAIGKEAADRYGTIPLDRRAFLLEEQEDLRIANIIQHPDGRLQEIVVHDNAVVEDEGTLLYYLTDTEGGSSGSPIFDNHWRLIGLHHAATENHLPPLKDGKNPDTLNEGIKISAIASDLERRQAEDGPASAAATVLDFFIGINSATGYFGTLGRPSKKSGLEALVATYKARDQDVDIGAWNIEWFSNRYETKLRRVAGVIADFNLDIWTLVESSPEAAQALVDLLKVEFGLDYAAAHSEPAAGPNKQSTSMVWNSSSVEGERVEWPEAVRPWFEIDSGSFSGTMLEGVHGKIFDRYPGLFRFEAKGTDFDFYAVPLHLKALNEGALRREMASKIIAAAINRMIRDGADKDWVLLGDFDAELASKNFAPLKKNGFVPLSAEDEQNGAFTYLRDPHRSAIDHVFLSPYLARQFGPDIFFTIAADKTYPDYVKSISDHRPVVSRLSLRPHSREQLEGEWPQGLKEEFRLMGDR